MRIDIVTIFPEYLAPLRLSLLGRAWRAGLLDVRVTDLRDFTHDRHRTVDDTPYGGGAGMVMSPQPWGEALDDLVGERLPPGQEPPVLIVPGPAGQPFTQAVAAELAAYPWLVFACGRYEGIDERVREHARDRLGAGRVREISLGDYVLNGGEVAALAMVEAIVRLLPGVLGNAESLREESHAEGLLEYPVYTKPATWRGHDVPPVLLSGDHAAIAAWRHEESLRRTAARRPDLVAAEAARVGTDAVELALAVPADAGELWTLTLASAAADIRAPRDTDLSWARTPLEKVRDGLLPGAPGRTWVARDRGTGRMVGSVRGALVTGPSDRETPATWEIGRHVVAPDLHGRGYGRALLSHALAQADPRAGRAWLEVSARNTRLRRMYRRAGFAVRGPSDVHPGRLDMERPLRGSLRAEPG